MTAKTKAETRKVRVHEQRTYVEEEPLIESDELLEEIPVEVDTIGEFLRSIDSERQLTLQVFALPKYGQDGKYGSRSAERTFVTSFPFSAEEVETYRGRIQYCYPQGGMFSLEIRERGMIQKVWTEAISAAPGYKESQASVPYGFPPPPVINVNNPRANGSDAMPAQRPTEQLRDQLSLLKELGETAKMFVPPPPIVHVGEQQQSNPDRPLEERLFEAVALKALESDKVPIDRLLDALGGGGRHKEPSIMEGVLEILKAFAPTIDKVVSQVLSAQQRAMMGAQAPSAPSPSQLSSGTVESAPGAPDGQGEALQATDPIARDWFQVIIRMLEDATRHVELASVGGGGKNVAPSAEAVIELLERYPEQLGPTISQLLTVPPEQVLDLCSIMMNEQGKAHIEAQLKPFPAAGEWIAELQSECKRIIEDAKEQVSENENEKAN